MPTANHRKRKMDDGTRALANMRLALRLCNFADYAKDAGISFESYLARALVRSGRRQRSLGQTCRARKVRLTRHPWSNDESGDAC